MARSTAVPASAQIGRLDAGHWINAALEVLAYEGIDGVRVEPLAKRLSVTKGSFYWHFKDRDAFLDAMLARWRERATLDIIDRVERLDGDERAKLEQLLRLPFRGRRPAWGADVEMSIRLWGRRDPRARAAIEEVDRLRLRHLERLLTAIGLAQLEAETRAVFCYAFIRVAGSLAESTGNARIGACIESMLAR